MDSVQVNKALTRHVYKALINMQSVLSETLSEEEIVVEVKKTTSCNKPTPNIENAIHMALLSLIDLGIIESAGESTYILHKELGDRVMSSVQIRTGESTSRGRCNTPGVKRGRVTKPGTTASGRWSKAKQILICHECVSDICRFGNAFKEHQLVPSSSINLNAPMVSRIEDTPVVVNDEESSQDAAGVEAVAPNMASNEDVCDENMEDDTN